jgi:single-stranded-DNA-specific exonuclease
LKSLGYSEFESNIISRRVSNVSEVDKISDPKLKHLDSPFLMADMSVSVDRLIKAIQNKEVIGIETDHDCDGQTSHAIIYETLVTILGHPASKVRSYIGHRMKEGYGLSDALATRIIQDSIKVSLLITADNGSSDEARIDRLKEVNIDTIVTDHHAIPLEGIPKSAYAVLNPTRDDCAFPDKLIAGCMVAWLFMAATRNKMLKKAIISNDSLSMDTLLDLVAVGTVADCVNMADSINNRAVTLYGMKKISSLHRECWQVFKDKFKKEISSEFIGFIIAPLLNSDGRLSDALSSVNFLLSNSRIDSNRWITELTNQNEKRKEIQKRITDLAMIQANKLVESKRKSIVIYLESGHAGVHGISASRIKDMFGRPTIIFSHKDAEVISGSARSIDGLNIKKILDSVNLLDSDILIKYGGHSGAAGMSIYKEKFNLFYETFEQELKKELDFLNGKVNVGPVIFTDGSISPVDISMNTVMKIKLLEPFGRGFESPVFQADAVLITKKMVGKEQQHAQLSLNFSGKIVKGIWFNAKSHSIIYNISINEKVSVIFKLGEEFFNGQHNLSAIVEYIVKI